MSQPKEYYEDPKVVPSDYLPNKYDCLECKDTGEVEVTVHYAVGHYKYSGQTRTEYQSCQECCPHDEHDHGICLDCGLDNYEHLAAAAYDRAKDSWKYGG